MKAIWLQPSSNSPPVSVTYLADGILRSVDANGNRHATIVPPPLDKGYTNAVLSSLTTTNFDGIIVPLRFVFHRYGLKLAGRSPAESFARTVTEAQVSTIGVPKGLKSLKPEFAGSLLVRDNRFRNARPSVPVMFYSVSNNTWPDTQALWLKYKQEAKISEANRRAIEAYEKNSAPKRRMIRLLFGVCVLGFGYVAWRIHYKSKTA